VGGALRLVSPDDRAQASLGAGTWLGEDRFATAELLLDLRSSIRRRGTVVVASSAVQGASRRTPLDLWPAGDNGLARPGTLRAHPVLDHGRLRVGRLGRLFAGGSLEAQRWWAPQGRLQTGAAVFLDAARTWNRVQGPPRHDVDVGAGVRLAIAGLSGTFRADVAKGLRDGATWASFVYEP
jgi:hypothetical protein